MRLRDYWLEVLATCVTAVMLVFVYSVLDGYAAGPVAATTTHHAAIAAPAPQPWRLADSVGW